MSMSTDIAVCAGKEHAAETHHTLSQPTPAAQGRAHVPRQSGPHQEERVCRRVHAVPRERASPQQRDDLFVDVGNNVLEQVHLRAPVVVEAGDELLPRLVHQHLGHRDVTYRLIGFLAEFQAALVAQLVSDLLLALLDRAHLRSEGRGARRPS